MKREEVELKRKLAEQAEAEKQHKKRKIGIRADHPNEIWHLDVSYFILPDKSKCFIQAIIDNYSRYVIADWLQW